MRKNKVGDQRIQAQQYQFPYHYIPDLHRGRYLSRHWGFAPSYVAALKLVWNTLSCTAKAHEREWQHIDIGCGDGALIHYLSLQAGTAAWEIDGVDVDDSALAWARLFNPRKNFLSGRVECLEKKYDSVSLIEVIEHVDPELLPEFMRSIAKLMKPNGYLIITVPSTEKPVARKHFQHFSFESIGELIEPSFRILTIRGFERTSLFTRIAKDIRINRFASIDAPILNKFLVHQYSRLFDRQAGCGRIFVLATTRE
ncbi:MAG: class I SAM-dependent methyltransferase [Salinarimonas sp.]|nr:class I SAM-dependent methyltransferase [Salinarimonas sp.]